MLDTKVIESNRLDAITTPVDKIQHSTSSASIACTSQHDPERPNEQALPDDQKSASAPKRSKFKLAMILTAIYLSLFIAALDVTIVSTAVPTITSDLDSPAGYAWIGGAYLIAQSSSAPIWAKLSDIWGRKPILLAVVVLFAGSSIICALAVDMKMLIIGRALQGSSGGGLMLMTNIVISDIFSMRRRSLFLGFCEAIWAAAGAIGPVLGGVLTDLATWRWCWWINLPCCGITFVLLVLFLDVHNPRTPFKDGIKAIDWAGSFFFLGFTLMLLLGLDFGGAIFPWSSPKVICLIVFGALCSVLFIYSEKKLAKYPLVPLKVFNETSNLACLFVTFFHGFSFVGAEYYLPLYFQAVMEASALRSGILLMPLIVFTAVVGVLTGLFIHKTGRFRELVILGPIFLTIGNGTLIDLDSTSTIAKIIGFQIMFGIGSGLQFEPAMIAISARVQQDLVGTAISTYSFCRSMGTSTSVVLGGVVFQNSMDGQNAHLRSVGIPANVTSLLTGKYAAANAMIARTISDPAHRRAVEDAFAISLRNMWIMYTCFSFCGIIAALFVTARTLSKEHTETVTGLKNKESTNEMPLT